MYLRLTGLGTLGRVEKSHPKACIGNFNGKVSRLARGYVKTPFCLMLGQGTGTQRLRHPRVVPGRNHRRFVHIEETNVGLGYAGPNTPFAR